jgi:predicted metalloprotease
MKWQGRKESENVEDRRGRAVKAGVAVGGGGLLVLILAVLFGADPQKVAQLIGQNPGGPAAQQDGAPAKADPEEEKLASFTKVIFHDTEEVWDDLFRRMGRRYEKPTLVLFSGRVESACGLADAAVGPFYCPGDAKVYIDLDFYRDMQRKLGAPGEFARAYVVAHEVGHHVQRLLGYADAVDDARRTQGKVEANRMSVRLELQADFLAGVWAHHGQERFNFLEEGDIESAMNAANQIGDDRLQKQARGYVVPDAFTHGTSRQRMRWFSEGLKTGDVNRARRLFELPYGEL